MIRRAAGIVAATLAAILTMAGPVNAAPAAPPVGHVFVIVLENENFDVTWGPDSPAPFLATTLRSQGTLLEQYFATGHFSLDNYVTMISGQPPNIETQADCINFTDFAGVVGPDGIAVGQGCVYPPEVRTLADQLDAAGLTWAGYMQDMGDDPVRDGGTTCAHPPIGPTSTDPTQAAAPNDQYATRHNPFMYFHSIIDEPSCHANVVNLRRLATDLASVATTPNFSFITPDLCNDGHDAPCVTGEPGGLAQADTFLREVVPQILGSPAFQQDGLLLVTFDEAEASGGQADATACCDEPTGPNTPLPGQTGPGGGRVGMLAISPFVTPGAHLDGRPTTTTGFFGPWRISSVSTTFGYAGADGLAPFGVDVFGAGAPTVTTSDGASSTTSASQGTAPGGAALPSTGGDAGAPVLVAVGVAAAALLLARAASQRRLGR